MKAKLTVLTVIIIFIGAQSSFGNGISLNSIGPKSLGMGGAFVGVADDYTAIYWNPAGITQLKNTQVALFATDVIPVGTFKNSTEGVDAKTKSNHYISPNLMGYLPLMNGDLTIGLGVYVPAGLGTEWDGAELASPSFTGGQNYEWMSKIAAFNFSPGVAYKILDNLSAGAALNIYYGMFDIKRPLGVLRDENHPEYGYVFGQYTETSSGTGYGVSAGILWKPLNMLSVGLSFKSQSKIKFSGTASNSLFKVSAPQLFETDFDRDVMWPMWLGIGLAYKPIEGLTIAFDAQFSQWSKSEDKFTTDYKSWEGVVVKTDEQRDMLLLWKDCWQFRVGANYEINKDLQARIGFYHDPAPAPNETMNVLFPSNTYIGLTLGASYRICPSLAADFGFEYLLGDNRDITLQDYLIAKKAMIGEHHTDIIAFSLGFNYTLE